MSISEHRPTTVVIDLDNLSFNLRSVRQFVGSETKYLAVVKANAYGHGAVECARRLSVEGVDWFGVALPEEGVELRKAGITELILLLGGFWPGQEHLIVENRLVPVVFDLEHAALLDRASEKARTITDFHVKIDTGMGRLGVRYDLAADLAAGLRKFPNIRLNGLMTHFAAADLPGESEFTRSQIERFDNAVARFSELGFDPTYLDLANSPAAIAYPSSRRNMVRLGGVLYGLSGDVLPPGIEAPPLKPVLSLISRISQIKQVPEGDTVGYGRSFRTTRDSRIASVPIGYADGYPRSLSNNGRVIIDGEFAPVVGRISMDWTLVDVTDVPRAVPGSEVILIGAAGEKQINAEELAKNTGTISYEITCGIGQRVGRRFKSDTYCT